VFVTCLIAKTPTYHRVSENTCFPEAFNHAYAAHAGEFDREKRAHMIAWTAVKRSYVKADDEWVPVD
jgi:cation transport regulator ChaB